MNRRAPEHTPHGSRTLPRAPRLSRFARALVLAASALAASCALEDGSDPNSDDSLGTNPTAIVNGTEATGHPEACVIAFGNALCSGSLIAPNVVLTAGHCVYGATHWQVTCPYSSDTATVTASQGEVAPNYPNLGNPNSETIDNSVGSDIGLIRLDRALRETRVGRVRLSGANVGTQVRALGRINSGRLTSRMYASPVFAIAFADTRHGYWVAVDRTVIESGDSGGPLEDAMTGEILAVNSAGIDASSCRRGAPCDEWAVLGAASSWFNATVTRYTGSATTGGTGSGSSPPPPTTTLPPPATGCAAQTSWSACTAQPTCGWCNGHCVDGTSSGGGTCTSSAGDWAWLSSQCATTGGGSGGSTTPSDPCASSTSCASCTARASCGWCNGHCMTGTGVGPSSGTCGGTSWAWYSSQCGG